MYRKSVTHGTASFPVSQEVSSGPSDLRHFPKCMCLINQVTDKHGCTHTSEPLACFSLNVCFWVSVFFLHQTCQLPNYPHYDLFSFFPIFPWLYNYVYAHRHTRCFLIIVYFIKISHVIHHPCTLLDSVDSAFQSLPAGQHSLIQSSAWLRCPISGMGHNWFSHSPIPRNTFYTTICTETNMKTDNEKHNMFWWFYFPLESFWEGTAGWKSSLFFLVCLFCFLVWFYLCILLLCVLVGWLDSEPRALCKPGKCSTTGLCP